MRRSLLALPLLVVAVMACADDDVAPAATTGAPPDPSVTLPTVPADDYAVATGPDDVVIDVSYEGGFAPPEAIFTRTPVAMVVGDGRLLSTGPVALVFPGPLLPNVQQQSITPAGIQRVVGLADELGLLAELEYARNDQIADAPDTVVTITVDGTTYRHQAYALGLEEETDPARAALQDFVDAMTGLAGTLGDELGPSEAYVAADYLVRATPVDLATLTFEVEPTEVPWPADSGLSLADAAECATLPAAQAEAVFIDANQLTFFTEGDVTYQVAAVQQVPGRSC